MVMIPMDESVMMPVQPLIAGKSVPMPRIDKATVARIDDYRPMRVMVHLPKDVCVVTIMAMPVDGFIPVVLSHDPVMCGTHRREYQCC